MISFCKHRTGESMGSILVRDVPDAVARALKERAARNHRSLQQELLAILQGAATAADRSEAWRRADAIRQRLGEGGRAHGDSVDLIREDRER